MLAPDLLRTDSQENIYLQADGVTSPVTISISIQDFAKTTMLFQDSVTLNQENGFHTLKSIQVSHHDDDVVVCSSRCTNTINTHQIKDIFPRP